MNQIIAAAFMTFSVVGLTAQSAFVKMLSSDFSPSVLLFYRSLFILTIMVPVVLIRGRGYWWPSRISGHFWRSLYGFGTLICYFYAIEMLPLADAVALSFTRPIWAIFIAALLLKEALNRRQIIATLIGFLGIVLISQPHGQMHPAVGIALLSAIFAGFSIVAIRQLTKSEPIEKIVLYFALFTMLMSAIPAAATWNTPINLQEVSWLVFAALGGLLGQMCMAHAAKRASIATIVPLDYMRVPGAAVVGYFLFADMPPTGLILGSLVVLLSSVLAITPRRT